jgi:hypothetical protein
VHVGGRRDSEQPEVSEIDDLEVAAELIMLLGILI